MQRDPERQGEKEEGQPAEGTKLFPGLSLPPDVVDSLMSNWTHIENYQLWGVDFAMIVLVLKKIQTMWQQDYELVDKGGQLYLQSKVFFQFQRETPFYNQLPVLLRPDWFFYSSEPMLSCCSEEKQNANNNNLEN